MAETAHASQHPATAAATAATAIDPVCGMTVTLASSKHQLAHGGQVLHFCCARCREKFAADPGAYLRVERVAAPGEAAASAAAAPAIDPVCGMQVDPARSTHRFDHGGQVFHFCSSRCREKFSADPAAYLRAKPAAAPAGTIYTCPMHPEIRQAGPGSCPICGMALEPLVATAEAAPNHELIDMTRRFWIGAALAAPVFALEMGGHLPWLAALAPPGWSG